MCSITPSPKSQCRNLSWASVQSSVQTMTLILKNKYRVTLTCIQTCQLDLHYLLTQLCHSADSFVGNVVAIPSDDCPCVCIQKALQSRQDLFCAFSFHNGALVLIRALMSCPSINFIANCKIFCSPTERKLIQIIFFHHDLTNFSSYWDPDI